METDERTPRRRQKKNDHTLLWILAALGLVLLTVACFTENGGFFILGCFFWGGLALAAWALSGGAAMFRREMGSIGWQEKSVLALVLAFTMLLCTAPMGLSPIWNGETPGHRNQYELTAEAFLAGRLDLDLPVDSRLTAMENPYDHAARKELGLEWGKDFFWDHAFYNNRYYMYFGVVPVLLTFLPYRAVFGTALTTYRATQLYTAITVLGLFALMYLLARRFFRKLPFGMYLAMAVAFSGMSVWYAVDAPALYCTAITAALCLQVWSIFFFVRAVWVTEGINRQIRDAFFGALLGALVFGCRPSIALANLLVIPMLLRFLKDNPLNGKLAGKLALAASPYVLVAVGLMLYNYARFDNPFEFGQSYQLTLADQKNYGSFFQSFDLIQAVNGLVENFLAFTPMTNTFPYVKHSGVLLNFPMLLMGLLMFQKPLRRRFLRAEIWGVMRMLLLLPLLITVVDVMWTPFLLERYRMDIYYLMGIWCFLVIGFRYEALADPAERKRFGRQVCVLAAVTVLASLALYLVPVDGNYTATFPQALEIIRKILLPTL